MTYIIIITIAFIVGTLCYAIDAIITDAHVFRELRKTHWETVLKVKMWLSITIIVCTLVMLITGIIGFFI